MVEKEWRSLLIWTFRGERFEERGIDIRDLQNLLHLRTALVELAKRIWKERNEDRDRLPKNAEDDLELRIFGFGKGSVEVDVHYARPAPPPQMSILEEPLNARELHWALPEAARRTVDAMGYLATGESVPDTFPSAVLSELHKALTLGLGPDEAVSMAWVPPEEPLQLAPPPSSREEAIRRAARRPPAPVVINDAVRRSVTTLLDERTVVARTITGEVTMANVRGHRASIFCDGAQVSIEFPEEREEDVTRALHEHKRLSLRVRGQGELDLATGRLKSLRADDLEVVVPPDPDAPSELLFERLAINEPERLLELLNSDLTPALKTFAAEIAGRLVAGELVVPVLLTLLEHPSPAVREGAVCGLAFHEGPAVDAALQHVAKSDGSPGVRDAARDVLEGR